MSGAADRIVAFVLDILGTDSPRLRMVALFVVTAALGQFVSNTATTLIMAPVAVSAAATAGVSPKPILVMLAVVGGAALLTPIATPPNLMIMGPAGFRFGEYWRLGIVVMAWWFVVAVGFVPLIWQF
jgi:di/tricarboxylate transporter